jgi:drug/metabolite transporter (DMT)-like permease
MRSDLFPDSAANLVPQMQREAIPFALLAVAAGLFAAVRGAFWPRGRRLWASIVVSLGLFVAPAVLVYVSHEWVSAFTRVALFSLTPVFAIVFEPYIGAGNESQNRRGLLAALASVVGTLFVFPIGLPGSIQAGAAFAAVIVAAACVAAANCKAVRVASQSRSTDLAPMAAVAGAAAAAGLVAVSALTEGLAWRWRLIGSDFAWSSVVALPGLLLLFWLMPRMTAVRMTIRFVVAPLMAILIGMAMARPDVEPRTWLGLLLIAAGAGWLLLAPEDQPEANLPTLKPDPD